MKSENMFHKLTGIQLHIQGLWWLQLQHSNKTFWSTLRIKVPLSYINGQNLVQGKLIFIRKQDKDIYNFAPIWNQHIGCMPLPFPFPPSFKSTLAFV